MTFTRGAARSPLFLRVLTLMLLCVGVVQLMNVVMLVAVQTPSQKVYTVGEIVDSMTTGRDHEGDFSVSQVAEIQRSRWNPRGERIQLALATALGVPIERVEIRFPRPFLSREQIYDRAGIPHPAAPPTAAMARGVAVIGSFSAALKRPDGSWVRVEPARGFEPWRWFVLVWLVLSAIAVGPFAWALAHRLAKPIGAFAEAAERLGRDPRAAPLALGGPPEIAEAAAAFNQMQARLNRYVDDRTLVIGALAHDLRTPLMRLGLRLEDAPEGVRAACESDIRDMQAMISATLAYVRDTGQPAQRRPLDLRSLAETITDDLSDRGEAVSLTPGDPVVVDGNSAALKSMLSNLVSNAVKYAGGAEVSLALAEGQATLEVRDHGPGIPPGDLDHVFEPFFRGERSRNRDTGGIGLGLASARAVARAHGGDITLANAVDGGLRARVTLPV
ncbi:ATP-binding protein [Sphingomonas sp. MMS12-HWE2-04]|uniref:ATP-binding protein n=1 Tax=Sphingomonas sp. MMS12-HWE2-04 TaxID=3234199 RepID=UPI0038510381